jgi:ATP-grasp domain
MTRQVRSDRDPGILVCKWQPDLAAALVSMPVRRYLVLDGYDRHGTIDGELLARFDRVYNVSSFDSLEELAAVASDLFVRGVAIDSVLSHHEFSQLGAGYLDQALVATRHPRQSMAQRDKRMMKAAVRQRGVMTADFVSLADRNDSDGLDEIARRLAFPVVLKPAVGFGAMNTVRIDTLGEIAGVLDNYSVNPLIRSKQMIVEEFIDGEEVCVDAMWHDDECLSFVVHQYLRPRLKMADREVRTLVVDGSCTLDPATNAALFDSLRVLQAAVNDALGIHNGATHMEVFVRADGSVVFGEIASRLGGFWIPMMLDTLFGQDVWRVLAEVHVFGKGPRVDRSSRCVGGINIRPSTPGVISRVPSDEQLRGIDGLVSWKVVNGVGTRARLAHPSEQYLMLTMAADDPADFRMKCERLEDLATIEVV